MKQTEKLPDELTRRLAVAREQIEQTEALPLPFRYVMPILAVFGPRWNIRENEEQTAQMAKEGDEAANAMVLGWQRRAWNALLCTEKVVPLWNPHLIPMSPGVWSSEDIEGLYRTDLSQIIKDAKSFVRDATPSLVTYSVLVPSVQTIKGEVSHLGYLDRDMNRAVYAYNAVESALGVVRRDENHEFKMNDEYSLHWYGETEGILAVYCPSLAFSIETCDRDDIENKERLKEFWLWWLDEAVPASWFLRELR